MRRKESFLASLLIWLLSLQLVLTNAEEECKYRSFSLTKNEEDQWHSNDNVDDHYFYFSRVNLPSEVLQVLQDHFPSKYAIIQRITAYYATVRHELDAESNQFLLLIGDEYLKVMTTSTEMTVMEMKSEWISALDNIMRAHNFLPSISKAILHEKFCFHQTLARLYRLRNDLTEQMMLISESSSEQQAIIESIKGKRDENIRFPLNDRFDQIPSRQATLHFGHRSQWTRCDMITDYLAPGDLLEISSFRIIFTDITPYEHWAVYSGERDNIRFIIHYGVGILDGVIEEIPFKFESRRQCRINNFLDFIHPPFLPTMVIHRARHMVLRVAKKISEGRITGIVSEWVKSNYDVEYCQYYGYDLDKYQQILSEDPDKIITTREQQSVTFRADLSVCDSYFCTITPTPCVD